MRVKSVSVLLCTSLAFTMQNAFGSAGYYPTKVGEQIQIQGCISVKAKSPFVIFLVGSDDKRIEIKRLKNIPKSKNSCPKGEIEIKSNWVVDRKGDYALYGRDLTAKKNYFLWPDGIESR